MPLTAIIARPFLSWNPSILTLLGLVSSMLFFVGIIGHVYILSIISLFGFIFDMLDGYVARATNKVTAFGGFLDSTLDRVSDFFFITSFGFGHLVNWDLVVLALFTSLLISYIRARGEAAFPTANQAKGLMQRTERVIFLLLAFFLFLLFPSFSFMHESILAIGFWVIFILNLVTIFQRFSFFAKR